MKKQKVFPLMVLGVLLASSLACLGSTPAAQPTYTPYPTYTDLPTLKPPTEKPMPVATEEKAQPGEVEGVDVPIIITWNGDDTELQFVQILKLKTFKYSDGSVVNPSPGNILLAVAAQVYSGGPAIKNWPKSAGPNCVRLLAKSGEKYWWISTSVPQEDSGIVGWFFDVPTSTMPGKIFLPGGVQVDISSLPVE